MLHIAAIVTSLLSLGLVCGIYYCNFVSRPGSWLRSEMVAMILLALLTGFFPLAVAASIIGLWNGITDGFGASDLLATAADLVSIAAIVATVMVFRALVHATYRTVSGPSTVTPLTPRPSSPKPTVGQFRKAA